MCVCVCVCNRMPKGKRNNTASKLSKAPLPIYRLQQSEAVLLSKYVVVQAMSHLLTQLKL